MAVPRVLWEYAEGHRHAHGLVESWTWLRTFERRPLRKAGATTESRRLRLCGRHVHDGFCASYVVEVIVGAHCDGMFAGTQFAQREFVALFERVADVPGCRHQDPHSAIGSVLCALDAAGCVAGGKFHYHGSKS